MHEYDIYAGEEIILVAAPRRRWDWDEDEDEDEDWDGGWNTVAEECGGAAGPHRPTAGHIPQRAEKVRSGALHCLCVRGSQLRPVPPPICFKTIYIPLFLYDILPSLFHSLNVYIPPHLRIGHSGSGGAALLLDFFWEKRSELEFKATCLARPSAVRCNVTSSYTLPIETITTWTVAAQ